jgi:nucleoside-diphosphate-sugar epimerase
MTSAILLTGGAGALGRLVARRLREANSDIRVLSRQSRGAEDVIQFVRGELVTGELLATGAGKSSKWSE